MKKYIVLFAVVLMAVGCSQDTDDPVTELNLETTSGVRSNDIAVCHKGRVIYVNENALNGHMAHGDTALVDNDGDGYVAGESACDFQGGDCDDNDPSVYPGAEELCADGIDNDCDGSIDEDCVEYNCPCFSYAEAMDYAIATAEEYYDQVCYFGSMGFTSNAGPNWGVRSWFMSNYCTDFDGGDTMIGPSDMSDCQQMLLAVQAEVQATYCGD